MASGAYDNLAEHPDGRYALQLAGSRVAASFTTSRSPVQYWAREVAAPLFTVPEPFRPPYPVLRTVEGRPVHADGTPDPDHPEPRRFLLRVEPDGTVHYADDDHVEGVGHLAYVLETVWGTTPAANDRAVLEILDRHWFGETLLSAEPPPVQFEVTDTRGVTPVVHKVGAFATLDADGRVTALGTPNYALNGSLLPELGQLHRLEHLDLSGDSRMNFHTKGVANRRLLWNGRLSDEVTETDIAWVLEQFSTFPLIGAIPPELGQLARLRHLDLSSNWLWGALPPDIGHLASLEYLDLGDNLLSGSSLPSEWSQFVRLQELRLDDNQLTGPLPSEWSQLVRLERLSLSHNGLTGPLPPAWGQLVRLEHLSLSHNGLTGSLPSEWSQLVRLERLSLSHNGLTGPLPPEWGRLDSLQELDLSFNQLTGSLPPEWGQLDSLQSLRLTDNQLTGSLPPEWGQLDSLRRLFLNHNQLTGSLPLEWSRMRSLGLLDTSSNQLTGCLHRNDFPNPNYIHIQTDLPDCPSGTQGH